MINWPEMFPAPSAQYTNDITQPVGRSNNNSPQQRRRFYRGATKTASAKFDLSFSEFKLFASFHRHIISNGNEWFNLMMLVDGVAGAFVGRIVKGRYSAKYRPDNRFDVSFDIEVRI